MVKIQVKDQLGIFSGKMYGRIIAIDWLRYGYKMKNLEPLA
jgi:hypothetical protein